MIKKLTIAAHFCLHALPVNYKTQCGRSKKSSDFLSGCHQNVTTRYFKKKEIPSSPNRSRTYDLPITSSDALPPSYRRLMGAKAIKLGSWDKHPAYC